MRVLLHLDPATSQPLGIWWLDDRGQPVSEYEDDDAATLGRQQMSEPGPDTDWSEHFDRLQTYMPYIIHWQVGELSTDEDPGEWLARAFDGDPSGFTPDQKLTAS
jgi:hypothetical protein